MFAVAAVAVLSNSSICPRTICPPKGRNSNDSLDICPKLHDLVQIIMMRFGNLDDFQQEISQI